MLEDARSAVRKVSHTGVSTTAGATALARMLWAANSMARLRVRGETRRKSNGSALMNALFYLPFSGMRAAINVKHFTRDELCVVQVHHRVNYLIDIAHSADGLKAFQKSWASILCIGVFMAPRATVLMRMPCPAYSIASARVTACNPPLANTCNAHGTPAIG